MKLFKINALIFVSSLVLLSCQQPLGIQEEASMAMNAALSEPRMIQNGAAPVQLVSAKASVDTYNGLPSWETEQVDATFKGVIEVANVAYNKSVRVHYTVAGAGWTAADAVYLGTAPSGREYWSFETIAFVTTKQVLQPEEIRFAVEYQAAGQTWWDNNGGQDYSIITPKGVGYGPSMILGSANLGLVSASTVRNGWPAYANSFSTQIIVKNLSYHKNIKVLATVDGWQSSFPMQATYLSTLENGLELWEARTLIALNVEEVEFALSYTGNGQTWWDNNFGQNYTLGVPESIQ